MPDQSDRHISRHDAIGQMLRSDPELAERARQARAKVRPPVGLHGDGLVEVSRGAGPAIERPPAGGKPGFVAVPGTVSIRWDSGVPFSAEPAGLAEPYDVSIELVTNESTQRLECESLTFRRRSVAGAPAIGTMNVRATSIWAYQQLATRWLSMPLTATGEALIGRQAEVPAKVALGVLARPRRDETAVPSGEEQERIAAAAHVESDGDYLGAVLPALAAAGAEVKLSNARKIIQRARARGLETAPPRRGRKPKHPG